MATSSFFKSTDTSSPLKRCYRCKTPLASRHLALCDDCFTFNTASKFNAASLNVESIHRNSNCKHCYRQKNDHRYVDGACPASEKMSTQRNWMDTTFEKLQ